MTTPGLRLRAPTPGLLALPWDRPLGAWRAPGVALRDLPVGPSRHLVRFVEADGVLWALKELPARLADREYDVLGRLERLGLPAVRPAGVVAGPDGDGNAVLVTRYLTGSWQYRRLIARLPPDRPAHRARLFDAMAGLLVELHRHGVFWGDCSLANTLFSRDGQTLQAWLVDAETSEVHPTLSDGQRRLDLDILVENVAAGMTDLAAALGRPSDIHPRLVDEVRRIPDRYAALWSALHAEPEFSFGDRYRVESTVRGLNDLGFAVDEVTLAPVSGSPLLRLRVTVGDRRFHAEQLRRLTGLDVGEGQARVLLGDLRAHQEWLGRDVPGGVTEADAASSWVREVLRPGTARAHTARRGVGSDVQAYCDLLEVRWLLSERAGADVGDDRALAALADPVREGPTDAAATGVVADAATGSFPRLPDPLPE